MDDFYQNKKVMVTGGGGFIGRHVIEALLASGAMVRTAGRRARPDNLPATVDYLRADLSDRNACREVMAGMEYVFHLAAAGAGFHSNLKRQANLLTENLLLNTTVMDCAAQSGVSHYLYTSSMAVYPRDAVDPAEDDALLGPPHPGEYYYAWAKRTGEIQCRAYYEQYQMNIAIVRPTNPYGPWDNFDPRQSHVIPALIRRALEGEDPFVIWGSGKPQRDFIHVRDVARGMLLALKEHAVCDPINLATGRGTAIADLANMVLRAAGRNGVSPVFDTSKADGPSRRVPKADKLRNILGMQRLIGIEAGLAETVDWFRSNQQDSQEQL